jgi:hypothetical protein
LGFPSTSTRGETAAADAELAAVTVPLLPDEPSSGTFLHPAAPAIVATMRHAVAEPRRLSVKGWHVRRAEKIVVSILLHAGMYATRRRKIQAGCTWLFEAVCF